jgi:hypothetical protein
MAKQSTFRAQHFCCAMQAPLARKTPALWQSIETQHATVRRSARPSTNSIVTLSVSIPAKIRLTVAFFDEPFCQRAFFHRRESAGMKFDSHYAVSCGRFSA